jgi:hypothetical protein
MNAKTEITVQAPKRAVWNAITDIQNAPKRISGIQKIEILEQPASGLVGLKWRETRTMFGKQATEVMWITEAVSESHYQTRAESHGSIYVSRMSVADRPGGTQLGMEFTCEPQSFGAKVMTALLGWMMKGACSKAMQKDLADIKQSVEKGD